MATGKLQYPRITGKCFFMEFGLLIGLILTWFLLIVIEAFWCHMAT